MPKRLFFQQSDDLPAPPPGALMISFDGKGLVNKDSSGSKVPVNAIKVIGKQSISLNPSNTVSVNEIRLGGDDNSSFFVEGELIIGQDSGCQATIANGGLTSVTEQNGGNIKISYIDSVFANGETVIGQTSGASATVVDTNLYEQIIKLFGGNNYLISDIILTNCSADVRSVTNCYIFDISDKYLTGVNAGTIYTFSPKGNFTTSKNYLRPLKRASDAAADTFAQAAAAEKADTGLTLLSDNLYLYILNPEGSDATVDIYVYGYTFDIDERKDTKDKV